MATLTYDSTPADQPEFNEAEQEALAIGEQAVADQNQMLAGKFKDAEALEQAYIELQKKLGETNDENAEPQQEVRGEEQRVEEEVETSIFDTAATEWSESGKLTDETIAELSKMDSAELVQAYINAQQPTQAPDLSDADIANIQQTVGGPEEYQNLMKWAGDNLDAEVVQAFDSLVETSNPTAIMLAVAGIKAQFTENNGYEGRMLTGKQPVNTADVFRSQAEVVEAMSNPRYDRDPAYRQDVFNKLERSNLQY